MTDIGKDIRKDLFLDDGENYFIDDRELYGIEEFAAKYTVEELEEMYQEMLKQAGL